MNMTTENATTWAQILRRPTDPRPGQYGPSQMVTAQTQSGEQCKLWFEPGELSALRPDDWIVVEWRGGKWRVAKTQAPELLQELRTRGGSATTPPIPAQPPVPPQPQRPPMQQPAQPPAAPQVPALTPPAQQTRGTGGRWSEETSQRLNVELSQRAALLVHCHKVIASQFMDKSNNVMVSEETIQKYATSLFISLIDTL